MHIAYILLGSNKGHREAMLQNATQQILLKNCILLKSSSVYATAPWGYTEQNDFLNQVIMVKTHYSPFELLTLLLNIEKEMGRKRDVYMGPREIDLDILFYDHLVLNTDQLIIPHPKIQSRRFVLTPLYEIVPNKIHPVFNTTIRQLLQNCMDQLSVTIHTS